MKMSSMLSLRWKYVTETIMMKVAILGSFYPDQYLVLIHQMGPLFVFLSIWKLHSYYIQLITKPLAC